MLSFKLWWANVGLLMLRNLFRYLVLFSVLIIAGSMFLFSRDETHSLIGWSVIWSVALFNLFYFILIGHMALTARSKKLRHGLETLVGKQGRAHGNIHLEGQAVIRGEIWSVKSKQPIPADRTIKVLGTDGLMLEVEEDIRGE